MTAHADPTHTNRLIHETSPYLLQHAHNPVDWYPWGEEALERARGEDRPILLSIGYSACHWCHVMERESFEDEEIARHMNEHFVCIKVDREERPDLDHVYMTAVQMLAGQGGWPMTVFLTPDGKPFYGGTYYPPEDRYGRPGFPRILAAVAEAWSARRDEVRQQGEALVEHIRAASLFDLPQSPVTPDILDSAFRKLRASYDPRMGGFGSAPKFPQPMILDFLLRYAKRTGGEEPLRMVRFTLERMAQGGIYDQLGGGFHRYSTDEYWLAPHFEKMLYDNAQLAQTYLHAFQATGDPFFRWIVEETLDYVAREMTAEGGGFYSTQDADSEGEEGKFFVWTQEEIQEALGPEDAALFCRFYDVTPRGNWEGRNILNVTAPQEAFARSIKADPAVLDARLAEMRRNLFAVREQRVHPGRDEKVLTGWNGMMIAAFAEAAVAFDRPDYLRIAESSADFIFHKLYHDDRLLRTGKYVSDVRPTKNDRPPTSRNERLTPDSRHPFRASAIPGFLEDYACLVDGLLRVYEASGDGRWLDSARALTDTMIALFADSDGGPFFNTPKDGERLVERPREMSDNAVPAGNSVAVDVLLRLSVLTGEESYHKIAAGILRQMGPLLAQHPQAFGRLLCAADFYLGPVRELAIIGPRDSAGAKALLRTSRAGFQPNLIVAMADPGDTDNGQSPLLANRDMIGGKPTAYLCEDNICRQPTTDPMELSAQLAR